MRRTFFGSIARRPSRVFVACLVVLATTFAPPIRAQNDLADRVRDKIDLLVEKIQATQRDDGSWGDGHILRDETWEVGETGLSVLALSLAGVPATDPSIVRGVGYLSKRPCDTVYESSIKISALAAVDAKAHINAIRTEAAFLVEAQVESGGWTYGGGACCGSPDNSNSQFAVLGLHEAARAGVDVPVAVWDQAWDYFAGGQNRDGGWPYKPRSGNSYGSMTTAGVSSLYVCALWEHLANGRCGAYRRETTRIDAGLRWLGAGFAVHGNPRRDTWKFYYLYGLERAATISARRYLGTHDWYAEGAAHLADNVSLASLAQENWSAAMRAFVLLFLCKGNSPVLMHKASWNGDWDGHRYDAALLTDYFGDEMLGQRLSWQVVPLDAPVDHQAAAPVLYISGRGRPAWTDDEIQKLKDYVATGGFVVVEAMEGDEQFDRGFRRILAEHFPEDALTPLAGNHPIYAGPEKLTGNRRKKLEAIQGPCWMSLVYCAEGMSCPWDTANRAHNDFRLGANILAFATGMSRLESKLDRLSRDVTVASSADEKLGGAFVLGQLVHDGDWQPYKGAWRRILAKAHHEAGMGLFDEPIEIDPRREGLFQAHLLSVTGTQAFTLDEATRTKLARYVERGGFVYAEASCGSREFDRAFRNLMVQVFPDTPLEPLPPGHALLAVGRDIGQVNYSDAVLRATPDLKDPSLEIVERDGRVVVVYSRYDLSSSAGGHPCRNCPAVLEPDASELLLKVILYALGG